MKKLFAALLMALMLVDAALGEGLRVESENADNFTALLNALVEARERPSDGDGAVIDGIVEAIRAVSLADGEVAGAIAAHWRRVYLDPDYRLFLHDGGERAGALEETGLQDSPTLAIVVLGYELKDGEMTPELMARCDAAAAVARSFPSAMLVCSGGPTGENNPFGHTEAGMMRDYLVETQGIDPARISVDEQAMTTVDNAFNTMAMLRARGTERMIIVTSAYHQRWGQAIYNAVAALYRRACGYAVTIAENYCCDIEPSREAYRSDHRIAARQLASVLGL